MADRSQALHQIVYISRSLIGGWGPDLLDIGRASLSRNAELGLTGALFFDGDRFAQVLEGPFGAASLLMERIRRDARHFDVRILRDAPVRQRRFAAWSMRFVDRSQAPDMASLLARERPGPALGHEVADRLADV
ncbi:MAG: BLUF domain-containing protein [Pseudomonadota bacterium]